jgi:hypothetical protein
MKFRTIEIERSYIWRMDFDRLQMRPEQYAFEIEKFGELISVQKFRERNISGFCIPILDHIFDNPF